MKKINYLFILLTYVFLVGCVSNKKDDENTHIISVDLSDSQDMMKDIGSLQITQLEEDENKFPGIYSKVEWKGDSIYILDSFKSRGLYLYDSKGKFIGCYNNVGQGPDEFMGLSDFILTDDGAILLDTYANPTKIFLDPNLSFLRKEEAENNAAHFAKDNKGCFWYDRGNIAYGDNKGKLIYSSEKERNIVLEVPKNLKNITFSNSNSFSKLDESTFAYLPVLEPYVYKCQNGEASKWIEFDFGDKWPVFDEGNTTSHPLSLMREIADNGKIYGLNMNSDNENFVFSFNCKDRFYLMILNQANPELIRLLHIDKDDMDKLGKFLSMRDGCLYFGGDGKITKAELTQNPI